MTTKYVYNFGNKQAEGDRTMKELLGGKGSNLAEMNRIGLPVPPGFTITTEACNHYFAQGKQEIIKKLKGQVENGIRYLEKLTGRKFGDPDNPILLSVRSGARRSMPGMMDTVLNIGLNKQIVKGFAAKTGNPRLAWDSYRRFIQMYGNVVLRLKPVFKEDPDPFEFIIDQIKDRDHIHLDTELSVEELTELVQKFKIAIREKTGKDIPDDPMEQIWGAILAVFDSWMNERAFQYRKLNNIPHDWGTAVNVQAMVFGNTGEHSATGVAFTRDPATGENKFIGEYLVNAQGEDVVAGIRTPHQISLDNSRHWAKLANVLERDRKSKFISMEELMPQQYKELLKVRHLLENHYCDMQDLEFTIEEGKLWILQSRSGKRTGEAMIRIAIDMWKEGLIDEKTVIKRIEPEKLNELLHPVFEEQALLDATEITRGLPASPGAASGQIVFFASDAEEWEKTGKDTILVRMETSPEDIKGMDSAKGILTSRGGMTSHAAVVARGMGKCCVTGAGTLIIDYRNKILSAGKKIYKEGDWISLNGSTGQIFEGKLGTRETQISGDFEELMNLADGYARLKVMANADTPKDAKVARNFGARGIGLCRTEHMFFQPDRIKIVREMILAHNEEGRKRALDKLLPIQKADFEQILEAMYDLPVTIRLLDPPLHEFLPEDEEGMHKMADDLGVSYIEVVEKVHYLHETNPMLGHRGCRLANTYPEISVMQTQAILEAAINLKEKGIRVRPEIMVPLTSVDNELRMQLDIINQTAEKVFEHRKNHIPYKIGTMIEIPRAALIANVIGPLVDFFSFGTNDLTQMTFGYSRDDIGKFLPVYLKKGILKKDPFQTLDTEGVGRLIEVGTSHGKRANPQLKVGVCGEHGGDPESIMFFHKVGLDYVSCSPFRVPIARLVAAQSVIEEMEKAKKKEILEVVQI